MMPGCDIKWYEPCEKCCTTGWMERIGLTQHSASQDLNHLSGDGSFNFMKYVWQKAHVSFWAGECQHHSDGLVCRQTLMDESALTSCTPLSADCTFSDFFDPQLSLAEVVYGAYKIIYKMLWCLIGVWQLSARWVPFSVDIKTLVVIVMCIVFSFLASGDGESLVRFPE